MVMVTTHWCYRGLSSLRRACGKPKSTVLQLFHLIAGECGLDLGPAKMPTHLRMNACPIWFIVCEFMYASADSVQARNTWCVSPHNNSIPVRREYMSSRRDRCELDVLRACEGVGTVSRINRWNIIFYDAHALSRILAPLGSPPPQILILHVTNILTD